MHAWTSNLKTLLCALSVAMVGMVAHAQSGLDNSLVFCGTTTIAEGVNYSWLVWQPTDPLFISSHTVAVYRKPGGAASPANYQRVSVVQPVVDTRLINSLLSVAVKLGQDLNELDQLLSEMYGDVYPSGTITTAEKISAVLSGAHGNAENMQRVILLGRQHTAMALCGGFAFADRLNGSGIHTYELRDYDPATGTDLGVLGRLTLNPQSTYTLPPPGRPVEVPDETAKGNLNVSMRWATPGPLRDVQPLHYGYDVYRVQGDVAASYGWETTSPESVENLIIGGGEKVNRLVVLPPVLLTEAQAENVGNIPTVFLNDDKGRYSNQGGLRDGQVWAYFVVARDLLGRGGEPSLGTLMTVHDRLPLNPPQRVDVKTKAIYTAGVRDQRLEVSWLPPDFRFNKTITAYYLYRWRSPLEMARHARELDEDTQLPARNLIAIVPSWQTTFRDDGSILPPAWAVVDEPAPSIADDLGKTYYYTVRAMDGSVIGNLSGNSAPAWGVLRDRKGPDGAAGGLSMHSRYPNLDFDGFTQVPFTGLRDDQGHLLFTCVSTDPGLDWAEFQMSGTGNTIIPMGRAFFTKVNGVWTAALRRTIPTAPGDRRMWCRVCTKDGVLSDTEVSGQTTSPGAQPDKYLKIQWTATVSNFSSGGNDSHWRHDVVDLATGETNDVTGSFIPGADAKEYKVYRRVNDSKQTLIATGEIAAPGPVTWTDKAPPASNATICYFLQLFDEHGNGGELVQQGECIESGSAQYMPAPMLEPLTGTTPLNPRMNVSWFCSIAGVERFEVWVARASGNAPGNNGSGLSDDRAGTHPNELPLRPKLEGLDFHVFETGLARHLSPAGEPHFSVTLPVTNSDTYTVMIRAVGKGKFGARTVGKFSNIESFEYTPRTLGISTPVPWPDRALPPKADFHPGVTAICIGGTQLEPWKGNAVRIGEFADYTDGTGSFSPDLNNPARVRYFSVPTHRDMEDYLYIHDEVAQSEPKEPRLGLILPVALYRVQVANANFPSVPGDIVQVSPLMEKIAQIEESNPAKTVVTDPFIAVLSRTETGLPSTIGNTNYDVLLLDRQPVIRNARYKYFLVRFGPTREIERVIVTNEVTASETISLPDP